jgi:hypothetical protein
MKEIFIGNTLCTPMDVTVLLSRQGLADCQSCWTRANGELREMPRMAYATSGRTDARDLRPGRQHRLHARARLPADRRHVPDRASSRSVSIENCGLITPCP